MKRNLITLLIVIPAVALLAALPGQLRTTVVLFWDYPANELSTNLTFKIYSTTNAALAVSSWPVLTNKVGTNTTITLPIDAVQRYYVVTASNWWGESDFSNVAGTPPLPRDQTNLRLGP